MYWYKNDATGGIGRFSSKQGSGWTLMTQEEIDADLLNEAKLVKINTLKSYLSAFEDAGLVYLTWVFGLSDNSTNNIVLKDVAPAAMTDRYKYYDMSYTQRDFADATGFTSFKDAMVTEKDRIMRKYNSYYSKIEACANVAAVDAITISFTA